MAIKGSLKEAGLPDILQLLALGEKTGCLSVTDQHNFGHFFFRRGRVVFANLVNREDRLGERLLAEGRVDPAALREAVAQQREQPDRRLGELLVERGALDVEDLWKAVADQIEETVYAVLGWSRGYFHFEPGQEPPHAELLLSLDVPALLMEGARRSDEWARIRKRLPHRRLVLSRASDAPGPGDGHASGNGSAAGRSDATLVWEAVDGRRDVGAILAALPVPELRAMAALHDLLAAGRLAVTGESAADDGLAVLRRRDEVRNLGLAFYGTRMYAEATREFRQMAALDERDAEARFLLGLVAFHTERYEEAADEFARFVEIEPDRPSGHLNLALARESLGRLDEAARGLDGLRGRVPDGAPVRLHRAILDYRQGAHGEALARLEDLDLPNELAPVASFYRGLLHALFWDLRSAREHLAAIPQDRQNARVLNNLGAVLERGDRLEEARLSYAAALEMGGAEATARKNLGDLHYREGKYDHARRSYLLALQEDPANGEALSRLGDIAFKEGRRPEAVAYWEKALEADPGHDRARSNLTLGRAEQVTP